MSSCLKLKVTIDLFFAGGNPVKVEVNSAQRFSDRERARLALNGSRTIRLLCTRLGCSLFVLVVLTAYGLLTAPSQSFVAATVPQKKKRLSSHV